MARVILNFLQIFARPAPLFFVVNLIPLVLWLAVSDDVFYLALQGYKKASFDYLTILSWLILFLSFWFGAFLASHNPNRLKSIRQHSLVQNDIKQIQKISSVLAVFGVTVVGYLVLKDGINIFELINLGNANQLKLLVYESDPFTLIMIMPRHLVLTALIALPFLESGMSKKIKLLILVAAALTLTILTSSRLTAISCVLIWLLSPGNGNQPVKEYFGKRVAIAFLIMIAIFAFGVITRSVGTWSGLTGSDNLFINATAEFMAYYISPVNYSNAIANTVSGGDITLALMYTFGFIFSVLNIDADNATETLFSSISNYYNSSLNQIGIIGQFFSGYSFMYFIPIVVYGYFSQALYLSYTKRTASGILIYPLIYISIFDSFRGFLVLQNILAANLLFVLTLIAIKKIIVTTTRDCKSC